jgi:transcriptional regulator with XRE-family HTH domain
LTGALRYKKLPGMNALRQYRESAGLTQEELGAIVGVTKATLSRYENGTMRPRDAVATRLEEVTGIDYRVLRGGVQQRSVEE